MRPSFPLHRGPDAPWLSFTADWYGQTPRYRAQFSLALDGDQFIYRFRADKAAECDLRLPRGQFVEGLWEQDGSRTFCHGSSGTISGVQSQSDRRLVVRPVLRLSGKRDDPAGSAVTIENSRDETS